MEGNIVGEPFDSFVRSQINIRQQNQFGGYDISRTSDQLQYLTNRNAWIKLASSVEILPNQTIPNSPSRASFLANQTLTNQEIELGESKLKNIGIENPSNYLGTQLAEKAVLFNSISEYIPASGSFAPARAGVTTTSNLWANSFAYGIGGADYGIQPPPGIIGITVDSLNRGSIRKATVTLKAHNKFQFDIIELLYLRLGFTMMLEWGWDKYLTFDKNQNTILQQVGTTIIEDQWFKAKGTSQLEMLQIIQGYRVSYAGNYDGFFGKVSNFTWNFNPDGSYDISIDLITIGDVIESLKVNTSIKNLSSLLNKTDGQLKIAFKEDSKLYDTNISKVATLNTLGYFLYTKVKELSNNFSYGIDKSNVDYISFPTKNLSSSKSPQYYIRLYELLSQIEEKIIPKIQNDGSTPVPQISFEKSGCLISYFPNQIPLDPRVCIFKAPINSYGDITGINSPFYFNKPYLATYIISKDENTYGSLMNLYINFEFISQLLLSNGAPDQDLYLFKFLQDLCNGINNALGGVNKLEPIIKDDYKITLIDQTLSIPAKDVVNLEVYGYNPKNKTSNFVKDIKFISKITPQLASMISIGATAAGSTVSGVEGTAFSKWSKGLQDRFALEILEPKESDNIEIETSTIEYYKNKFKEFKLADQSAGSLFEEATESVMSFIHSFDEISWKILGALRIFQPEYADKNAKKSAELAYNVDKDDQEKRIVKDPLNSEINNKPMFFKEYLEKSIQGEIDRKRRGIYKADEINELVSSNYALYLLYAFGGSSDDIKVTFLSSTPNSTITNYGNSLFFANQEATIKNLQIDEKKSRYLEFDEIFISQGKSAYKEYINSLNNNRYKTDLIPSNEVGFIPLSFDITLDGISGIKIYNKLSINNEFLPSNYPESLNFIITKVNHRIENNSWDTSLSTISMPKTEPYKFNSVPSITNEGTKNIEDTFRKDPKLLKTSFKGKEFIKRKEGFESKAYEDGGSLSIGYGFKEKALGRKINVNTIITKEEADTIFDSRVIPIYEKIVQNVITAPLTQYEFDSLVSIAYNAGEIGNKSAGNPTPLRDTLNSKNYLEAANIIPKYRITSQGIINSGLQSRRIQEQQVFISGNYG